MKAYLNLTDRYSVESAYLAPALVESVMPPPDVEAERLPNGGLFMLASEEPFDVANPRHVATLDAIQKALAPVQRSVASVAGPRSADSNSASHP